MSVVRMMISAADIQAKVKQLGEKINAHYAQSMDKKPIAKAKVLNKRKIGWILLASCCAALLRRDSHQPKNDTFSAPSKGA